MEASSPAESGDGGAGVARWRQRRRSRGEDGDGGELRRGGGEATEGS